MSPRTDFITFFVQFFFYFISIVKFLSSPSFVTHIAMLSSACSGYVYQLCFGFFTAFLFFYYYN